MTETLAIGWYGKLPTLGDFASRRLSPAFTEAWDGWLAAGLAEWQRLDADGWLTVYLASPSRRFVLLPGVVPPSRAGGRGGDSVAGVLMPSVDRVGRYFPLTLAFTLPRLPVDAVETAGLLALLAALDDAAADALHDDWPVDRLDAELAALAAAAPRWLHAAAYDTVSPRALRGGADAWLAQVVRDGLHGSPPRRAWWLAATAAAAGGADGAATPPTGTTTFDDTAGLPRGADFIALWGGTRPTAAAATDPS